MNQKNSEVALLEVKEVDRGLSHLEDIREYVDQFIGKNNRLPYQVTSDYGVEEYQSKSLIIYAFGVLPNNKVLLFASHSYNNGEKRRTKDFLGEYYGMYDHRITSADFDDISGSSGISGVEFQVVIVPAQFYECFLGVENLINQHYDGRVLMQ